MILPKQFISEEGKNDLWVKEKARNIIMSAASQFTEEIKKDALCWDIYHNRSNNNKFKYLTEVEGFTYPAKFRNIGNELVRGKLNLLESKQARRTFRFKAIAMDERSLKAKAENHIKAYLDSVKVMYEERSVMMDSQIQQVQDKLKDLQDQVAAQPQNEQQAAQLEQLKTNMPMIQLEYGKMIRALSREKLNGQELQDKIDYYLEHTDQEIMQVIANASLKSAIQTEDLNEHWNVGLKEKIVTGKPTYITYYDPRKEDVIFKQIDAYTAYFSRGGNNKWTNNGEWCMTEEHMTMSQAASEFELTDTENNILAAYTGGDYNTLKNYVGNGAYFDSGDSLHSIHDQIPVQRVWFLAPREIFYKQSPNKHRDGESFYNLIEKDTKIKKDEIRNRAVIYDCYHCIILGNIVCINMGKQDNVFRPKDMPGLPALPLVARSFNAVSDKPYSMIYRLRELIELYDIVNYKKELTIAMSGVKGMIMDKSQKPESMSTGKWMYYRRLGTMWIETMKKGRKVPATFNQFQNFDDGLNDSIQWFDVILNGIDAMMSKIIGITPSSEGQFVSKDPVQNVKMSNEQSALITEIQFAENDKIFQKAIEQYLNLKIQFVWEKGKVINYMNKDLEEVLIQIPHSFLSGADFRLYSTNNIKEDSQLEDLRQVAIQSWSRMELPIASLVSLFKIDDLIEMEQSLMHFAKEAEGIRQNNAMELQDQKAQGDQQTAQLKGQIDGQLRQQADQLQQASVQIQQAQLQLDTQKFQWESQYKERELQAKTQLESMKVGSQNELESGYLQEEARANRVNEMMKGFELKINAIMNQMQLQQDDIHNVRKTHIDHESNMRNKVNLKS